MLHKLPLGLLVASALLVGGCRSDDETTAPPSTGGQAGAGGGAGADASGDAPGADSAADVANADADAAIGPDADASSTADADAASDADASSTTDGGAGGSDAGPLDGAVCAPTDAAVASVGQVGKILLQGTVVTPTGVLVGEVLVEGDTITCVAASCSAQPGAATASVVATGGIIFPGLIDTHNHILFDIFDEDDWSPTQSYTNHNQWPNDARYSAMLDAKQYLNGEGTSPDDLGCELDKYGELKGLVAGTTSIVGSANPANKACYGSLARTIDQTPNGLGTDKIQAATIFPTTASADGVCTNFTSAKTDAYVVHVAEGVDATALKEFAALGTITTTDGCLYAPKTTVVHGTALGDAELGTMATSGMSLVWSPRSNVFLYGAGTDLTKTANIPLARAKGINVAIAPDWSIGGSPNLLDELRFGNQVDDGAWGDVLGPQDLFEMATINAAKALGLGAVLGSVEVGKKADLMVIGGDASHPYDALLAATPKDVRLVLVGGVALYGDAQLGSLGPASPGCEALDVCCQSKFVCVAQAGGTATDKLGQTYAQIGTALEQGLAAYDALNLTQWKFMPLAPLVKCP